MKPSGSSQEISVTLPVTATSVSATAFSEKTGEGTSATTTALSYDYKNENGQAALPTIATSATTTAEFSGLNLNRVTSIDLSSATKLTTISPKTFAGNAKLTSVVLPAQATKFESLVEVVQSSGRASDTLSYKYDNAAFANNAALTSITYKNFGVATASRASELNGSEISGVKADNWDTLIKNNSHLWSSIATVMNSLGYDAELNKVGNDTGRGGQKEENNYLGVWLSSPDTSKIAWLEDDLTTTDSTSFTDNNKWYSTLAKAQNTSEQPDTTLSSTTNTTLYYKHNGVIWELVHTKGTEEGATFTISLSTHSTTVPNVFKGTYKFGDGVTKPESSSPTDTAYTFKTWEAPTTSGKATTSPSDYGVTFTFKVTA